MNCKEAKDVNGDSLDFESKKLKTISKENTLDSLWTVTKINKSDVEYVNKNLAYACITTLGSYNYNNNTYTQKSLKRLRPA